MVLAFMLASLLPWVYNKPGFYLVLGSSNVDEGLHGYLTKRLASDVLANYIFLTVGCVGCRVRYQFDCPTGRIR
ncbi:hypothetical protein L2E82_18171 [Cichorium intybus]|uniref:Uncharacterized protein n=1 Tax=Cichorium intybus TaxID=13427 RepID=A0ACB9FAR9_CICIN|nr:hypothetical protein L2E82_18171 [Cichorium intybus]